jgi:hypothetical protein
MPTNTPTLPADDINVQSRITEADTRLRHVQREVREAVLVDLEDPQAALDQLLPCFCEMMRRGYLPNNGPTIALLAVGGTSFRIWSNGMIEYFRDGPPWYHWTRVLPRVLNGGGIVAALYMLSLLSLPFPLYMLVVVATVVSLAGATIHLSVKLDERYHCLRDYFLWRPGEGGISARALAAHLADEVQGGYHLLAGTWTNVGSCRPIGHSAGPGSALDWRGLCANASAR